jgi:hypothetical protein
MKLTTYNEWLNECSFPINENKDVQERIKKICIERLSQFFRVPASKLMKFRFDGTDDVRQYTDALNATSYEGAEAYYKAVIRMAKSELGVNESGENELEGTLNEGAVKQFEADFNDMVKNIKSGYGWIDPEFVADTWENSSDTIDFDIVKDEIYNRLIKAGLLFFADTDDEEKKGKKVTNISQIK